MPEYNNDNKGVAFRNDYKKDDRHPDYKGKGNYNGQDFEIAIWERTSPKGQFFSISFSEPYVKEAVTDTQSGYEKAKERADMLRQPENPADKWADDNGKINLDDIPF